MAVTGAALAAWGALLGFLDAELAHVVEGLGRRLAPLMEQDPHDHDRGAGEPDGFAGIARRGDLSRLLLSEWMLAQEEPDEFLRRFVTSELAYLAPEHREPKMPGRIVVIADPGPDQVGSPRLVHLAALAVLHRRAAADGASVALGLLGDDPGTLVEADDLRGQLDAWRRARASLRPEPDVLEAWLESTEAADRCWVLGAEPAFETAPDLEAVRAIRRLGARELTWTAEGVTRLDVRIDHRRLAIEMPPAADAVRLLRGADIAPRGKRLETVSLPIRFPRFTGRPRRLVCRTDRPDEIMSIRLADGYYQPTTDDRRRYRFDGQVIAAGASRGRTVVLIHAAGRVKAVVMGRAHRAIESIELDAADLGLDRAIVDELVATDLAPLLPGWDGLIVRLGATWRVISSHGLLGSRYAAIAPSDNHDVPRFAVLERSQRVLPPPSPTWRLDPPGMPFEPAPRWPRLLGPASSEAIPTERGYDIASRGGTLAPVDLEPDTEVLGIAWDPAAHRDPFIVTRSPAGRIIRCHWPDHTRTLSSISGNVVDATLHPTENILVVQRSDGTLAAFSVPDEQPRGGLAVDPA